MQLSLWPEFHGMFDAGRCFGAAPCRARRAIRVHQNYMSGERFVTDQSLTGHCCVTAQSAGYDERADELREVLRDQRSGPEPRRLG